MKAPVFAALAPGVVRLGQDRLGDLVEERDVRRGERCPRPAPWPASSAAVVERERHQPVAADQRQPAQQRDHALHRVAPRDAERVGSRLSIVRRSAGLEVAALELVRRRTPPRAP